MTWVLIHGLAAFFVVEIVRALPIVERLVLAGVKPFACNLCMSFWAMMAVHSIRLSVDASFSAAFAIQALAAGGIALALLYLTSQPPDIDLEGLE